MLQEDGRGGKRVDPEKKFALRDGEESESLCPVLVVQARLTPFAAGSRTSRTWSADMGKLTSTFLLCAKKSRKRRSSEKKSRIAALRYSAYSPARLIRIRLNSKVSFNKILSLSR